MDGIECALRFAAGVAIGFASGLLPGLHSNTVIAVLASLGLDGRALAIIIISLFPAHMVSSFIPSIFFGVPESTTVVSILPGQRMVLRGEGIAALKTVLLSCLAASLISAALLFPSLEFYPLAYGLLRGRMGHVLFGVSVLLVAKTKKPHLSLLVFLLAGILGHFSLNSGMEDPFLPLFSGMFALAAMASYKKGKVPPQKDSGPGAGLLGYTLVGVLLGLGADLLPGVGSPSQAATFATIVMPFDTASFLATISAVSVSQAVFSLSTSVSIGKSRVGATAWLADAIDIGENLPLLLACFLGSVAVSAALVYAVRLRIAKIASLDFSPMNAILGMYLVSITFIIDGPGGLLVLSCAAALGIITLRLRVERTNLMGAIIVPTLMLLFRIFI